MPKPQKVTKVANVLHGQPAVVNNSDLFLFALYRLGGAGRYVDVEDVFIEMWKLAPERFGWRKYKYPQYKIAHVALTEISRQKRGQSHLLMRTPDGLSRQLTAAGVRWVASRLHLFQTFARGDLKAPPNHRPSQRVLATLEHSQLVREFLEGQAPALTRYDAAALLRCSPDSPQSVWTERMETLRSAATDARRDGLLRFLEWLAVSHPDWFGRP